MGTAPGFGGIVCGSGMPGDDAPPCGGLGNGMPGPAGAAESSCSGVGIACPCPAFSAVGISWAAIPDEKGMHTCRSSAPPINVMVSDTNLFCKMILLKRCARRKFSEQKALSLQATPQKSACDARSVQKPIMKKYRLMRYYIL